MLAAQEVLRIVLSFPDGAQLENTWTWGDISMLEDPSPYSSPPDWLMEPSRSWPDPAGPIILYGKVPEGFEAIARRYLRL